MIWILLACYFLSDPVENQYANRRNTNRIFDHIIEEYVMKKIAYVYDFTLID